MPEGYRRIDIPRVIVNNLLALALQVEHRHLEQPRGYVSAQVNNSQLSAPKSDPTSCPSGVRVGQRLREEDSLPPTPVLMLLALDKHTSKRSFRSMLLTSQRIGKFERATMS